ncbi:MAG: TIM barrel protein [Acidobacteria bacterium]|nr:TIM barrel protein [Acidobacteriota bacterium]
MMDRRSFLGVTAGTLAAASVPNVLHANLPGEIGLRLSVTWGLMHDVPVGEALAMLTRHGYDAYEMFDWRNPQTLETFVTERKKYPQLTCATLVANKSVEARGCGLVNPREREGFLRELTASIDAAKKVESTRLVVLTGNELGGLPRSEQMANVVSVLREAAPILERSGITAVLEILNTYVDHAGYFLYYVRDAAEMIDRVGSPNVKILFDIYHVQIMEGSLIENIRMNIDRIGHFHIGDVPGRHEPGTGEINYRNVFKAIYDLGDRFQGYAALEYNPTIPTEDNLRMMRKMANFG